jgi:hypothetical protein
MGKMAFFSAVMQDGLTFGQESSLPLLSGAG